MADNITVPTQGTGDTTPVVATDQNPAGASEHYQMIKPVWGPLNTYNLVDVASGKPLPVQLRSSTGEDIVKHEDEAAAGGDPGIVGLYRRTDTPVSQSGTDGDYEPGQMKDGAQWVRALADINIPSPIDIVRPANTTTYAVGDAWSEASPTAGGYSVPNAVYAAGMYGMLSELLLVSSASPALTLTGEVWFFNQAVTNPADNAAFSVTDAEAKTVMGVVPFTLTPVGGSLNSVAYIPNVNMLYTCIGATALRFIIKVTNAYIPVSAETLSVIPKIQRL